ncbi:MULTISPECIES: Na+/H+ antiporter subunit E [unclassified Thauera]|uniref:Na+/H+ antiporter subunit E n=1 Tax=unclassified Thauera TaxID=2609274 RepID=UPI0002CE5F64|nr:MULTISPECIES: Na+/H+ antiporter subunit E [unclassified Thauera]ENO90886.1 cation antiporter [Thauera sp. 28]HNR59592.1 Na+/H+ antiporter subunit E [Thauera sp.]
MPNSLQAFSFRALALLLLWWTLSGGEGLLFGLATASLAAALSLRLTPPATHRLHARRIPRFAAFFLLQSLRAGWDVARRTLHPALPLDPGLLNMATRLPEGAPCWWLMLVISLLPGTLSVRRHGNSLEIHCLDAGLDVDADLRQAETQVARLFGLTLARIAPDPESRGEATPPAAARQ